MVFYGTFTAAYLRKPFVEVMLACMDERILALIFN